MVMELENKRRKLNPPPRRAAPPPTGKKDLPTADNNPKATSAKFYSSPQEIQKRRNFAVAQAQQEGCMGNFRIIDSPFGNFLIPAIPTRTELGG